MIKEMTNAETAKHLREFVKKGHGHFAWPTDACGYDQHIKFVRHRNENWKGGNQKNWKKFVLNYANKIEEL